MADHQTPKIQLIDGEGTLLEENLKGFVRTHLQGGGGGGAASYPVISILGPQSGGKSTLLNKLYGTAFKVMDATVEWTRATMGIVLAESNGIILMDVEGCNSGERKGDRTFESKLAAFSFAISGIVLVNMANNEIGRDESKSYLQTVLEVMLCIWGSHKFTIIVVVRDRNKAAPFEKIEEKVNKNFQEIWESIQKPSHLQYKKWRECFDVHVAAIVHYENPGFDEEVAKLKAQIDAIVSDSGTSKYTAGDLATNVPQQWGIINREERFDLPAYKECIYDMRCRDAKERCIRAFKEELDAKIRECGSEPLKIFPGEVRESLQRSLEWYNHNTIHFNPVSTKRRSEVHDALLDYARSVFEKSLPSFHSQIVTLFGDHLEAKFESGHNNSSAEEIIENCINESLVDYHNQCNEMIIWEAQRNDDDDHSLRQLLEGKAKSLHESVGNERCCDVKEQCVDAFKMNLDAMMRNCGGQLSEIFPLTVREGLQRSLEWYDQSIFPFSPTSFTRRRSETQCALLDCAKGVFETGLSSLHSSIKRSFGQPLQVKLDDVNDNSTAKEIIDTCIEKSFAMYHQRCKEMIISMDEWNESGIIILNAEWNIASQDCLLRRHLQEEAKRIYDSLVTEWRLKVAGKVALTVLVGGAAAGTGAAAAAVGAAVSEGGVAVLTAGTGAVLELASGGALAAGGAVGGGLGATTTAAAAFIFREMVLLHRRGEYVPDDD